MSNYYEEQLSSDLLENMSAEHVNDAIIVKAPTYQKLRRQLLENKKLLLEIIKILSVRTDKCDATSFSSGEKGAIFCAYTDTPFSADGSDQELEKYKDFLNSAGWFNYRDCAIELIEQELIVMETAISGLNALNCLGAELPFTWSNYPIEMIAREITQKAKAAGGRLYGFKE
ncbi:hypothetical protein [Ahrensia sp. 13_GOM-1096m]|uniref:hypothetical protein n=1 Tax=Ahrensia sp. 13_GOM-1096m TaxID=1380380 RepID=UPI00047B918E|nr:hypothetical protein [Ahrensia sp. 13_GOM-1096m]